MRPLETGQAVVVSVSPPDLIKAFNVSNNFFHSPELITFRVCLLTTLTGVLMLLSVLLASYRRRSKNHALKAVLWASYTLTGYLITFTLGQMFHSSSSENDYGDNIIWALFLLIVFGSADSFSSYSLVDSDQWRRYNCQFVLKLGGLMILLVHYYELLEDPINGTIILLIVLVIISKVLMKNLSIEASGMAALHRSCKCIVDYMITEHEVVEDASQADPLSMRGYRYLVQGEPLKTQGSDETGQVVTLENVWNCRWELLSSRQTGDGLKDKCLSFSLYRLLRLKYAGYKLPREVHRKMFRLVRHGLMVSEENGYERALKVVEDELTLLFDSFYTKRPIIFEPRGHRLWIRFAEFLFLGLVYSVFIYSFVFGIKKIEWDQNWTDGLYLITSLIALVIYLLSEILQSFVLLFTTWMKVMFICKYVKGDLWQKRPFLRKCIEWICKLPSFTPWERKLHQYSLFESYTFSPLQLFPKRFMDMFVDSPRKGQKEVPRSDFPVEVRKAVFDCLKNVTDSPSNDEIIYLRRPHVSWECDVHLELENQAEVIMVWHIATAMCSGQPSSPEGRKNRKVAMILSKYLAYLVAFAPRLLPNHPYLTEYSFDQTITEARLLFKGCKTVTERIDKLRESERESGKNNTTLIRGARLAKQLSEVKVEADAIWETLAKFWTEMMLYIAPSKDNRAHAEILAFGGEFVTHLWALLYHAGIERSKGSMPSHPHVDDTSYEVDPSTMPMMSEAAASPVSTEIEDAVVPPMITDKKPELG